MFRKDIDNVMQRNIEFAKDTIKTGTLLHILAIDGYEGKTVKPLEKWSFPEEMYDYLNACIERETEKWSYRNGLDDDTIPTMKPYFGISIHSAFIGGEVKFGGNTSYHIPLIQSWENLDKLKLREDNIYLQMLLKSMEYLKKHSESNGYLVSLRGGDSPMDIANALRGNDLFLDFYDDNGQVHKLMNFCVKAARWTWQHQTEIIDYIDGGRISGQAIWIPGNSIGHLSEDASSMCSVEMYEEFGKPYTEKMLETYDFAIMHVHTKGRHQLSAIADISKIKFIQLEYDPSEPSPIEVYKQNIDVLKNKIVVPIMTTDEIEENIDFLSKHKQIIQIYAKSMADAKRAINLVKSLR